MDASAGGVGTGGAGAGAGADTAASIGATPPSPSGAAAAAAAAATSSAATPHASGGSGDMRVHAALLFVRMSFAVFHVLGKHALAEMPPVAFACMRGLISVPPLLAIAYTTSPKMPSYAQLKQLAMLGLLGVTLNQMLFIRALSLTSPTNVGIIQTSTPVFTTVLCVAMGLEASTRAKNIGIGMAVTGALIMVGVENMSLADDKTAGNLFLLGACMTDSVYLVLSRPMYAHLPPVVVTAYTFTFGTLGISVMAAPTLRQLDLTTYSSMTWLTVCYAAFVASNLCYTLMGWANKTSSPAVVSAYVTVQPLCDGILAYAILGDVLELRELLGAVLIVGGMVTVSRAKGSAGKLKGGGHSGAAGAKGGSVGSSKGSTARMEQAKRRAKDLLQL